MDTSEKGSNVDPGSAPTDAKGWPCGPSPVPWATRPAVAVLSVADRSVAVNAGLCFTSFPRLPGGLGSVITAESVGYTLKAGRWQW